VLDDPPQYRLFLKLIFSHYNTIVYLSPRTKSKQYLVPQDLRAMIHHYIHDSALSAHLGVAKTLRRMSKIFDWPGIRPDVAKYVRQCGVCQRAKPAQNTRVGLHNSQIVTKPIERIFIDFEGPIVRSRQGNLALLFVLDGFSKFVYIYPVRKITSDAVVKCLVGRYFSCFGIPTPNFSDNAMVFKSRLFYNTCFSWGIKHTTTSPYYPQGSQVERFNRNLKAALTIYHNSQHTRWDENLPYLTMALNTAWHESTGATPSFYYAAN
jgi:hypothetical protein